MMTLRGPMLSAVLLTVVLFAATSAAHAQEATPAPSPVPTMSGQPTKMDRQYDGQLHGLVAPYAWAPTVTQRLQYTVPTLPQHGVPLVTQTTVQVGPSNYLSKVNFASMLAVQARQGEFSFFGDYIYANASTSGAFTTTISGPKGKIQIPISFNTNSRLAAGMWELDAGYSLGHGHNADVNLFAGVREFPISLTLDYNAVIGKRGIIAPSGSLSFRPLVNDAIFGLRGSAYFGGDHWNVPYYVDYGIGPDNQSWQGYTGAGYVFDHGQSLLLLYRTLNYNSFTPSSTVQHYVMSGPLLGYTMPF
jgi:hypothetical protein